MSQVEVQALLDRLVAQFASPYDFLRELVQNAMDAGSDRAEVALDVHSSGDGDEVVFELRLVDSGAGMDEAIVDGELTRLFSSGKSGDRTMAGGFGIGFVSVFAWQPEAVIVQTGRAGEAWEVVFYPDRRFERRAIDGPFEGTTVTLLRRGRADERPAIAEAIRDALWRWCRFCRIEVTFEDVAGGEGPELIQDSPAPTGAELQSSEVAGDHTIRVAYGVPPRAVLLRRGLILAEGPIADLLPGIAGAIGEGREHLQVWADSPALRTTLARDKVVADDGLKQIEGKIGAVIDALRQRLCEAVAQAAAESPWTRERHRRYAFLHGHLACERAALGARFGALPALRLVDGGVRSADALRTALAGQPLLYAAPAVAFAEAPDDRAARLLALARGTSLAITLGDADDRGWLAGFAASIGSELHALDDALGVVTPAPVDEPSENARAALEAVLRGLGGRFARVSIAYADYPADAPPRPGLCAVELVRGDDGGILVLHRLTGVVARADSLALWLDADDALLRVTAKTFPGAPQAAILALGAALLADLGDPVAPEALAEAVAKVLPTPAAS
ncbi:MAG: ATP-binding protein [Nannocystaceae bacterium]